MNHGIPSFFALAILAILPACGRNERGAQAPGAPVPSPSPTADSPLLAPERATAQAPEVYKARLTTTKGDVVIEVHRAWAPRGADRFYNLVQIGYYDGDPLFRVISGFMVQFGINSAPTGMALPEAVIADAITS
jgi:peptidyl-prolyl cis-trans isomerase A (cyclophilin A)